MWLSGSGRTRRRWLFYDPAPSWFIRTILLFASFQGKQVSHKHGADGVTGPIHSLWTPTGRGHHNQLRQLPAACLFIALLIAAGAPRRFRKIFSLGMLLFEDAFITGTHCLTSPLFSTFGKTPSRMKDGLTSNQQANSRTD